MNGTTTLPARDAHGQVVALDDNGHDYELTVRIAVELDRSGVPLPTGQVTQEYLLMGGRTAGVSRLAVYPRAGDDVLTEIDGPAIVELRHLRDGPDPLTLLRTLLTGQAA